MASFELIYEQEEDVFEVTFATFDEQFAHALSLNDNILLHTDLSLTVAWGLTFYSYARLLEVSETHLDDLRPLPAKDLPRILTLLTRPPVSHFLELLDSDDLRARVKAPGLQELMTLP